MKITAKNIHLSYGAREVLKGVDISGNSREFVGLIGPNGSGKSTLLKCIYRILKPDAGQIFLEDTPLQSMSYKTSARRMAVVAQHNHYNFDFSVEEIVLMGRAPHKKALERDNKKDYDIARQCLERVGMADFASRSFSTLSGGEQQRVILARALAQQTPCLILDEPTNHLDIVSREILEAALNRYEGTVLFVSHDRYFINAAATRILDLSGRRLTNYVGNYDYYLEKKEELEAAGTLASASAEISAASDAKLDWQQQKEQQARLRKLQNDLKRTENRIEELETRDKEIDASLEKEEIFTDVAEVTKLSKEKEKIREELDTLYEQWEKLQENLL